MVRYLIKHKKNFVILNRPNIKPFTISSSDFAICQNLATASTDDISTDPLLHTIDLVGVRGIAVSVNVP